jgi:hypothetical protein
MLTVVKADLENYKLFKSIDTKAPPTAVNRLAGSFFRRITSAESQWKTGGPQ